MKYCDLILIIFFFLKLLNLKGQDGGNYDYLKMLPLSKCYNTDMPVTDSMPEMRNSYLEIPLSPESSEFLLQARSFRNSDSTITIAVIGLHIDQQCRFYHTYFFEYSEKTKSVRTIPENSILPSADINIFFNQTRIPKTMSKYVPAINKENNGTMKLDDVLREYYNVRYIISKKNNLLTATLHVCDQITSSIEIAKNDEKILDNNFKKFILIYDKNKKKFMFKPKQIPAK